MTTLSGLSSVGHVKLLRSYQCNSMPGIVIAWELFPWGEGQHCSSSTWSEAWHSFILLGTYVDNTVGPIGRPRTLARMLLWLLKSSLHASDMLHTGNRHSALSLSILQDAGRMHLERIVY